MRVQLNDVVYSPSLALPLKHKEGGKRISLSLSLSQPARRASVAPLILEMKATSLMLIPTAWRKPNNCIHIGICVRWKQCPKYFLLYFSYYNPTLHSPFPNFPSSIWKPHFIPSIHSSFMAPINLKQSPNPTTTSQAIASSHDARVLVRETLRLSANLASPPAIATPPTIQTTSSVVLLDESECRRRTIGDGVVGGEEFLGSSFRLICCEEMDGRRWKYVAESDGSGGFKKNSFRALSLHTPQAPLDVSNFFRQFYIIP